MAGMGTGVPNRFMCPQQRRDRNMYRDLDRCCLPVHAVTLTGRTKATKKGNGHPRKSWTTFEYHCSCGHVGWSNHIELEKKSKYLGIGVVTRQPFVYYD